jgi:RNA polymerase sporulation-specific sigma factor
MPTKTRKGEAKKQKQCKFALWYRDSEGVEELNCCGTGKCLKNNCQNYKKYQQEVENIVKKAQDGDIQAAERLIKAFKNYVYQMEKKFFIPGGDREDLVQEAFIGLYQAIKTYQFGSALSFEDYLSLCIRNNVIRAVRSATQKKQLVLTTAKSIFDKSLINIKSKQFEPESATLKTMTVEEIESIIQKKLSNRESKIISLKAKGFSAEEIAEKCNTEKKIVDNALYRARLKIKKHLDGNSGSEVVNVRAYEKKTQQKKMK